MSSLLEIAKNKAREIEENIMSNEQQFENIRNIIRQNLSTLHNVKTTHGEFRIHESLKDSCFTIQEIFTNVTTTHEHVNAIINIKYYMDYRYNPNILTIQYANYKRNFNTKYSLQDIDKLFNDIGSDLGSYFVKD